MSRDSASNTFLVAGSVCGVCALLVSLAAVGLKPIQEKNKTQDIQKNILLASALNDEERVEFKNMTGTEISEFFDANFQDQIVDLDTGEDVTSQYSEPNSYLQIEAAELRKEDKYRDIPAADDIAKLKTQELDSHVYIRVDENKEPVVYIFPVRGKGLWSTLKGFIALKPDLKTISYLTYYSHAETPGLGGEVDNEGWKSKWDGKVVYNESGDVAIRVVKGEAANDYQVDGLSGATITSVGVQQMLIFWMGPEGFGPYIKQHQASGPSGSTVSN